jgi:hypothetical protein
MTVAAMCFSSVIRSRIVTPKQILGVCRRSQMSEVSAGGVIADNMVQYQTFRDWPHEMLIDDAMHPTGFGLIGHQAITLFVPMAWPFGTPRLSDHEFAHDPRNRIVL